MSEQTLLLVDGSSFLYRAFHAMPDLRNKEGEPTGAIYGVVNMLRRLREDHSLHQGAQLGAVVFDARGKTFRDDWYPEYKANRASMPDELAAQIEPIHAIVKAMGWPVLVIEGVEADDVIGTLAAQANAQNDKAILVTGDKDLTQLVNERTTWVNTMSRDGRQIEKLDIAGVTEKFGVPPNLIIDYLTLVGDTVDNVPGVEKVGPKTAVKWLTQYGNLDGIVANAASVTGAVGEHLRKALDWLPMGRKLVTVVQDLDLKLHLRDYRTDLHLKAEDSETLHPLFERYGMRTFTKQAAQKISQAGGQADSSTAAGAPSSAIIATVAPAAVIPPLPEIIYECISTMDQLQQWLHVISHAELTAVDTETTSLDPMQAQMVGISLSVEPGRAAYIPLAHVYPDAPEQLDREQVLEILRPWLQGQQYPKVGQNLKYDQHVFANHGIALAGIVHDTLLQSYVIEAHRNHDLGSLAERHLNRATIAYSDVAGKGATQINFEQVSVEKAAQYSSEDADVTMHLHQTLLPQVQADEGLLRIYREIEIPTALVLQKIERNGVLIDVQVLMQQSQDIGTRLMTLEREAYELAGQPFNLNSPKQIGEIFFEQLKLPVIKKTPSGAPSTDEEVLEKLSEDYPLPKLLLEYRGLSKLKSTYTDKLPKMVNPRTGRVHTSYSQAVAITGRLASSDPNLQNIPIRTAEGRRVREAFIAPEGFKIMSADYSQIELRIMAHISGDESLLSAFANGEDVHRATASEIFAIEREAVSSEQRRYAKVINFGLIYGMSAFGLASALNIGRDAAKHYIDRYFARYPGVAQYMQQTRESAKAKGYVETVFGRRLWLPEINSPNGPRRQGAERAAINAPMQGTAADLIKLSMIQVQAWLERERVRSKMIMQVHDELVLEVADDEIEMMRTELPRLMAGVAQLKVPLLAEVGVGLNWDQAH
jgi:DNA polymerase I